MNIRFFIDPRTNVPHIFEHRASKEEVEEILINPAEDRPGKEGSRVALGRTSAGRFLRVITSPTLSQTAFSLSRPMNSKASR